MATTPRTKAEPTHYGRPSLLARGWTDALIARHLGEPDATAVNPHHRTGPPRKLYLIARVEAVEQSAAFAADREAAARRKAAAGKAVATKLEAMRRHLDSVAIEVPVLFRDDLIRRACQHYNRRKEEIEMMRAEWGRETEWTPATPDSSPAFLDRISVNYLRHELSPYEEELERVAGRVGVAEAYEAIARKVFGAIAATYPGLAGECDRQIEARFVRGV